ILAPLGLGDRITAIVQHHHERWDGRGYPDGLAGAAIPLGARIVAAVDAFDAMTAQRPYGQPLALDAAIDCLRAGAGTQWDPQVVAALIDCLAESLPCRERAVGEAPTAQTAPVMRLGTRLQLAVAYVVQQGCKTQAAQSLE